MKPIPAILILLFCLLLVAGKAPTTSLSNTAGTTAMGGVKLNQGFLIVALTGTLGVGQSYPECPIFHHRYEPKLTSTNGISLSREKWR
jgi:hypothetical protein